MSSITGKNGPDQEKSCKYLPFGKKIVKTGQVDTEIALLIVKKKQLMQAKYTARSASLPSGIKENSDKHWITSLHIHQTW